MLLPSLTLPLFHSSTPAFVPQLSLLDYDSVINLDNEATISGAPGALRPIFDCAAGGRFITSVSADAQVQGGMFAARPSALLFEEMQRVLLRATYSALL